MSERPNLKRGDIWLFEPDTIIGREQQGVRPGIVVSADEFNESGREVVMVVPLTSRRRSARLYPLHVEIPSELSGLRSTSYAMCEQLRAVSIERVYGRRPRGQLQPLAMLALEHKIKRLLDLE